jgi:2-oxoglutarate ferredoxin oxidoreductase subunit alpha
LAELLAEKGYSLRCDKEYASVIKGDNNCFFISISSEEQVSLSKKIDLFFAFDDFSVEKNQDIYQLENIVALKDAQPKYINMFAFGACLQIVHISLSEGEELMQKYIKDEYRAENLVDLQAGYAYAKQHYSFLCETINLSEKIRQGRKLMMGNQLIGEGAVKAGLEFYSAYPMTPVTSLIDTIVEHPEVTFFQ